MQVPAVEFRPAGEVRISKIMMTQAQALEKTTPGYHVADSRELAVLDKTNKEVRALLIKGRIITGENGLARAGPCEILENGDRRPLSESWGKLSDEMYGSILDKFWKMPASKRGWEYSGSGPVAVDINYFGGDRRLGIGAGKDSSCSGFVVLVPNAGEARKQKETLSAPIRKAEAEQNEPKTFVGPEKLENLTRLLRIRGAEAKD
jgi:hypothetical protein